jgi:hypothetical protein
VTEQQWADFVAAEITPHFPQGLTINDAVGQWRDPDKNTIVKNVTIVVLQNEPVEQKIAAKRAEEFASGFLLRPTGAAFFIDRS